MPKKSKLSLCNNCRQHKYCKKFPEGKAGTHKFVNGKCQYCSAKGPACVKFPKDKTGLHNYK